jgi:hypothetical protein
MKTIKRLTDKQKANLKEILVLYKLGFITENDVYTMLTECNIMNSPVVRLTRISDSLIKRLGNKSTIILK